GVALAGAPADAIALPAGRRGGARVRALLAVRVDRRRLRGSLGPAVHPADCRPRALHRAGQRTAGGVLSPADPGAALPGGLHCGTARVWFEVAHYSLVPALVSPNRAVEANSSLEVSEGVSSLVGPALGGL